MVSAFTVMCWLKYRFLASMLALKLTTNDSLPTYIIGRAREVLNVCKENIDAYTFTISMSNESNY